MSFHKLLYGCYHPHRYPNVSDLQLIDRAVEILRCGGLVAFPTETVYGLGADAANSAAVERIFTAKGRPASNPLISHVADEQVARRYAAAWPDAAEALTRAFWPGPLTLVLPRRPGGVVPQATAGLPSVALRRPDHPLASALLRAFDGPIAAPSANRSTHVSPTTAGHVLEELGAAVDLILDGGPCRVGIESTVIDLTTPRPTILRPGGVTRERIERVIGPVRLFVGSASAGQAAASPGQQEVHYAPLTPAFRFERGELEALADWLRATRGASVAVLYVSDSAGSALRTVFEGSDESVGNAGAAGAAGGSLARIPCRLHFIGMPGSPEGYAASIYATLREWDACGIDAIVVEMPPDEPAWLAVRDRLRRATLGI